MSTKKSNESAIMGYMYYIHQKPPRNGHPMMVGIGGGGTSILYPPHRRQWDSMASMPSIRHVIAGCCNDWGSLTSLKIFHVTPSLNIFDGASNTSVYAMGAHGTGHRRLSMRPFWHELLARTMGYRLMPGRLPRTLSWSHLMARSRGSSNDNGAVFASPLKVVEICGIWEVPLNGRHIRERWDIRRCISCCVGPFPCFVQWP